MKIAVASDEKTYLTDFVVEYLKEHGASFVWAANW